MSPKGHDSKEVPLTTDDLEELTNSLGEIVDLRQRKYGFPPKSYDNFFIGSEAVAKMIKEGMAADEDHGGLADETKDGPTVKAISHKLMALRR